MVSGTAIGTITPSGNRVVERVTMAMTRDLPDISVQFTRIPVHGDTSGAATYDWDRMLDAATLLSHARPDAICWNGSKGGTLGFDIDHDLTARITAGTGVPAVTAALSILDALGKLAATQIALVTPYDTAYQAKCIAGFAGKGIETVSEVHSGLTDNFSYGEIAASEIAAMTRAAVAKARPQAVVYFCTNFDGAALAPVLEAELGIPVLDSTALGVWGALGAAGYDLGRLARWGRVFSLPIF
ncbi:MAG: Asp/Glu/hydantoin racemase [Rhizobiales bacterium]|nr:Asp/Glu/hydantoin racemase [Hyphomicrobiales bacterium]